MSEDNILLGLPVLATTLTWLGCLYCFKHLRPLVYKILISLTAVLLLVNIPNMLPKETSATSGSGSVDTCKRECKEGYDASVEKVKNAGLNPGPEMIEALRGCKQQCERNTDF